MDLTAFEGSPSNVLLKVAWPPREIWWVLQAGIPWRWGERLVEGQIGAKEMLVVPVS